MNLTEALNVALPEMPAQGARVRRPQLHPKLVGREQLEDGKTVVYCVISGKSALFRFPPFQWQMLQLFNGERTYEEISDLYFEQTGTRYELKEIQEMVDDLDAADFWYKTPLEQNVTLKQKLNDQRHRLNQKKSKYGDVSRLEFSAWDPDLYLERLHHTLSFLYTRWFTVLTLIAFALMGCIFVSHWSEIGRDTLQFYTFTEKNFSDIVEFWLLAAFVLFFHETGHGLTCKHYGGHVHRMGFTLIYFTPAFFTDVTEAWVYGNKWQRLAVVISGAWAEMLICAVATFIWWGTPYGTAVHDIAYMMILITGLGVIFFNYNPLIKLDGYYMLTELLEIRELKEDSTLYVLALVKKYLWRLPVAVPYVPKRRRLGFIAYAVISGVYSYALLALFARFIGNLFYHISPTWAFVPACLVALRLFKSRILTLGRFMKNLFLDKKERVRGWFTLPRRVAAGGLLALFLVVPWKHASVSGRFVLEPVSEAVLRAPVSGTIISVVPDEGELVQGGERLISMRSLQLESDLNRTNADLQTASAQAIQAQLRYVDLAPAENQRRQLEQRRDLLQDEYSRLTIRSPLTGEMLTPRLADRIGSFVTAGTELAEVGDPTKLTARVYVLEQDVNKVKAGEAARLHFAGSFASQSGTVSDVAPADATVPPGVISQSAYQGVRPPPFYVASVFLDNWQRDLLIGSSGTAVIFLERQSLAQMAWRSISEFARRKIW